MFVNRPIKQTFYTHKLWEFQKAQNLDCYGGQHFSWTTRRKEPKPMVAHIVHAKGPPARIYHQEFCYGKWNLSQSERSSFWPPIVGGFTFFFSSFSMKIFNEFFFSLKLRFKFGISKATNPHCPAQGLAFNFQLNQHRLEIESEIVSQRVRQ